MKAALALPVSSKFFYVSKQSLDCKPPVKFLEKKNQGTLFQCATMQWHGVNIPTTEKKWQNTQEWLDQNSIKLSMANTKSCSSVLASAACGGIIWSQTALSGPNPPIQPPAIHAVPSLAELQSVFVAFLCGHPMVLALPTSCSHH